MKILILNLLALCFCFVILSCDSTTYGIYDGFGSWSVVGNKGFTDINITDISLAVDKSNGELYVAAINDTGKANVYKMQNSNWSMVGVEVANNTESISLVVSNGTPCLAYADHDISGMAVVRYYNAGSWINLGTAGLSMGYARDVNLVQDDDTKQLYLAYIDSGYSMDIVVKKYNSYWSNVNSIVSLGATATEYLSLDVKNSKISIAYVPNSDYELSGRRYYTGSWYDFGTSADENFSYKVANAIDPNTDIHYMAFVNTNDHSIKVVTYDGVGLVWEVVGEKVSDTGGDYPAVCFVNNILYVAYKDWNTASGKLTVKSWDGSVWTTLGSSGVSDGAADHISMVVHQGVVYVAYHDGSMSGSVSVMAYK